MTAPLSNISTLAALFGPGSDQSAPPVVHAGPPSPVGYAEIHAGCVAGLHTEIKSVEADITRWGGDKIARVLSAEFLEVEGEHFLYEFNIDIAVQPPEFTAVDINRGMTVVRGIVDEFSNEGRTLIIAAEDMLDGDFRDMTLAFNPTEILKRMLLQLEVLAPNSAQAQMPQVYRTLGLTSATVAPHAPVHPSFARRRINAGQVAALTQIGGGNFGLVWGPPGTGKTTTLGCFVADLAETRDLRVLVTAHTNVALDTAAASVMDSVSPHWKTGGHVVRMGKLSKEFKHLGISMRDVAAKSSLSTFAATDSALLKLEAQFGGDDLATAGGFLSRRVVRKSASRSSSRVSSQDIGGRIVQLLDKISRKLKSAPSDQSLVLASRHLLNMQAERQRQQSGVAAQARIVFATLAKIAISREDLGEYDVVVVDELSMAMLPQILIAAGCSTGKVFGFGDPKQLPPVVQARDGVGVEYLKRNLFRHLGLDNPEQVDPRCYMLTEQFRMAPPICALVSQLFYGGRLVDAQVVKDRPRIEGPNLILLDTSANPARSMKSGSSRSHDGHGKLVGEIVRQLATKNETDIGVITPYRPQRQVLSASIMETSRSFFRMGGFVRTIHRSQGGEQDTIILDLLDVDPYGWSFLDEKNNGDIANLLCVALSRARNRLIIIANARSFRVRAKQGGLLISILERAYREGEYASVGADNVLPAILTGPADDDSLFTEREKLA
jgi:hypothetical protein